MGRRRVEAERLRELVRMRRLGTSARRTARLLRMGPNTERWYRGLLGRAGLLDGPPDRLPSHEDVRAAVSAAVPAPVPKRPSVEAWWPRLEALFDKGLTARAAFDRLRLETSETEQPFRGSYSGVKRMFRRSAAPAVMAPSASRSRSTPTPASALRWTWAMPASSTTPRPASSAARGAS